MSDQTPVGQTTADDAEIVDIATASKFRAWITKYALTEGIQEDDVRVTSTPSLVVSTTNKHVYYLGEGKDWHRTRDQAVIRAQKLRDAKIASLRKSIEKIEKMKFT